MGMLKHGPTPEIVSTGRPWQGFPCKRGRVLIVDNELHPETLASRLAKVIDANEVTPDDLKGRIGTVSLRGKLSGLDSLSKQLATMTPGAWDVVVIDALYPILRRSRPSRAAMG